MSESNKTLAKALLDTHGTTYCEELGIDIEKNTPSVLFRWFCASLLMSARISAGNAVEAAKALSEAGWTTAGKMAETTWQQRVDVLNKNGYARYDESTSRMLGDDMDLLMQEYGGDLRRLREKAENDPKKERELLKELKGIGDVGADIFFREVQPAWDELYPFADKKALSAAEKLGLPKSADGLSKLVDKRDFARLVAALVRTDLEKDYDGVKQRAEAA